MTECASCGSRLEEGLTRCPGCNASLAKPGAFMEVLGWVLAVVSTIPVFISVPVVISNPIRDFKSLLQPYYIPTVVGAAMFLAGIMLVFMGKSRSGSAENPVREVERESAPGS